MQIDREIHGHSTACLGRIITSAEAEVGIEVEAEAEAIESFQRVIGQI